MSYFEQSCQISDVNNAKIISQMFQCMEIYEIICMYALPRVHTIIAIIIIIIIIITQHYYTYYDSMKTRDEISSTIQSKPTSNPSPVIPEHA